MLIIDVDNLSCGSKNVNQKYCHSEQLKNHIFESQEKNTSNSTSAEAAPEPVKSMPDSDIIVFPTFKDEEDEHIIDIEKLCNSELALLKKNDPFMYYSIQGMHYKDASEWELDMSSLGLSTKMSNCDADTRKHESTRYIKRKSCISYESYFSVTLDDIAEIQGPSAKKHRPSSPDVDVWLLGNLGIARPTPSSTDDDSIFDQILNSVARDHSNRE